MDTGGRNEQNVIGSLSWLATPARVIWVAACLLLLMLAIGPVSGCSDDRDDDVRYKRYEYDDGNTGDADDDDDDDDDDDEEDDDEEEDDEEDDD